MSGTALRRLHGWLTVAWVLLIVPTVIWWRDSIAWIGFMSIYAIVSTHWAGWQGARAEEAAERNETSGAVQE